MRISSLLKGEGEGEEGGSGRRGRKQETLDVFVHQPLATSATSIAAHVPMATSTHTNPSQTDGGVHTVQCPICGHRLDDVQGLAINTHIDECLNHATISSLTASPTAKLARESPKKLVSSTETNSITSPRRTRGRGKDGKKEIVPGSRKRQQNDKSEVPCDTRKRRRTLDHFWNNN